MRDGEPVEDLLLLLGTNAPIAEQEVEEGRPVVASAGMSLEYIVISI